MADLVVHQFPCLQDNYAFLVHDPESRLTALVDTPEVEAIERALASRGWRLTHIFNTHHHFDHTGGNLLLKERYGCTIVGFEDDRHRLPGLDVGVREGDVVELGNARFEVFETPGHTLGHIAYFCREALVAFVGDTLFALGCGRLFEGSPHQMWQSLQKISAWPNETRIYCAHEYTEANAAFALTVEADNPDLQARVTDIKALRAQGRPTVPTLLELEKRTNPFLRAEVSSLQQAVNRVGSSPVEVFAEIRKRKDNF